MTTETPMVCEHPQCGQPVAGWCADCNHLLVGHAPRVCAAHLRAHEDANGHKGYWQHRPVADLMAAPSAREPSSVSRAYWEQRYTAHPDITGAGSLGRAPAFVAAQYQARMRQVERGLVAHDLATDQLATKRVLDVGAGTGEGMAFWQRLGAAEVAGLDFADASVRALRARFPDSTVLHYDITAPALDAVPERAYDLVSAFEVFLHVLDERAFRRGVAHCARLLMPGGWLIVSDPIIAPHAAIGQVLRSDYAVSRTVADWEAALVTQGMRLVDVQAATVLLVSPLQARTRIGYWLLRQWWRGLRHVADRERASRLLASPLVALDDFACRHTRLAPTSKLLFAQKVDSP